MLYSPALYALPEEFSPEGFEIRSIRDSEMKEWGEKLHPACGFSSKSEAYCADFLKKALPGGIQVAVELATDRLAASASAQHFDKETPGGLGWVMALPEIRGKKLGAAVVAAAMNFGIKQGLSFMALSTDDFRLPAIGLYLKYGWRPYLYAEDMPGRWRKVLAELNIPADSVECYTLSEKFEFRSQGTL